MVQIINDVPLDRQKQKQNFTVLFIPPLFLSAIVTE